MGMRTISGGGVRGTIPRPDTTGATPGAHILGVPVHSMAAGGTRTLVTTEGTDKCLADLADHTTQSGFRRSGPTTAIGADRTPAEGAAPLVLGISRTNPGADRATVPHTIEGMPTGSDVCRRARS